jgi:MFS family permease
VLPASLLAALGQALAFIPSLGTAIGSARPEEGGLAAGLVNTSYQVGSALGLAAMTAVGVSFGAGRIGHPAELTAGFSAAFLGAAGIAVLGAILVLLVFRTRRPASAPDREPARVG